MRISASRRRWRTTAWKGSAARSAAFKMRSAGRRAKTGTLEDGELQNALDDGCRVVRIGFDAMLGLAVGLLTIIEELPEFRRISGQRAIRNAIEALANTREWTIQPNGDAALFEQLAIFGINECAAAQSHHHGPAALHVFDALADCFPFHVAELLFTPGVEDLGDGDALRL